MSFLQKLLTALRPKPVDPEELAARAEAQHIRDEVLDERLSQRGSASSLYGSQRGRGE
jgi:hypothetical protein